MNINKRRAKLIARLNEKNIDDFVSADIDVGISFQIRAIREQRGWSQQKLADLAGKKQPWIAKLESPYKGYSLQTLKELASVFKVGLLVRFVPISELVERELKLSPESLSPVSFNEDPYFNKTPQEDGNTLLGDSLLYSRKGNLIDSFVDRRTEQRLGGKQTTPPQSLNSAAGAKQ